jgi:hypothetical protein
MGYLIGVSAILFYTYLIAICILNRGIPTSISKSWYLLKDRSTLLSSIFSLWCFAIAFLQMPFLLQTAEGEWFQFSGWLTAGGLALVGAAPAFKGHERVIHRVGAGIAAVFSILYSICLGLWFIVTLMTILCLCIVIDEWLTGKRSFIFWGEVCCFTSLFVVELISLS